MKKNGRRRNRTRKGNKNRPRFTDSGITTVSFSGQLALNFGTGSGVQVVDIHPTSGFCDRFESLAASFEFYRIVAFEYFLVPTETRVSNEMFGHALLPYDDNTLLIGTFGDLLQQPSAKIFDARMVTLQKNRLARKALLAQPTKWWPTLWRTGTPDDSIQAKFIMISSAGAVSNTIMWYTKFIVEFRSVAVNFISRSQIEEKKKEEEEHVKGCRCTKCAKNS